MPALSKSGRKHSPGWLWFSVLFLQLGLVWKANGQVESAPRKTSTNSASFLIPDRVFDGESGQVQAEWAVLVMSNRIAAVGPATQIKAPADALKIELPGTTLLPGLMDIHSHIFLHPYNETLWEDQVLKEAVAYRSAAAVVHVRNTLMAGFTLLRDLGTEG